MSSASSVSSRLETALSTLWQCCLHAPMANYSTMKMNVGTRKRHGFGSSSCHADWRGEAKPFLLLLSTRGAPHPATRRGYFAADPSMAIGPKRVPIRDGHHNRATATELEFPGLRDAASSKYNCRQEGKKRLSSGGGAAGRVRPSSVPRSTIAQHKPQNYVTNLEVLGRPHICPGVERQADASGLFEMFVRGKTWIPGIVAHPYSTWCADGSVCASMAHLLRIAQQLLTFAVRLEKQSRSHRPHKTKIVKRKEPHCHTWFPR